MTGYSLVQQQAIAARARHPDADHIPFDAADHAGSLLVRWERMVRLCADRPALREGARHFSYAEVDALTDTWARALVAIQGPEPSAVGLLFSLGVDLPLAMLAVWKAGKYFVWIEPEQPAARTQVVLEDAAVDLVLTTGDKTAVAAQTLPPGTRILDVETLTDPAVPHAVGLLPATSGDTVAYLIYTSGTTGRPKGVVELHRNLVHMIASTSACFHISPADRITLWVAGGGLLVSVLSAWLNGAQLLPFRVREEGLVRLGNWIVENELTILNGGSVLRPWLLSLDGSQSYPTVRLLVVGAAPMYREHGEAAQRYLPPTCVVMNTYTASESRGGCMFLMDRTVELTGRLVPVGYPYADFAVEIWDDAGQVLPPGAVGEVVLLSEYVAQGYWQRPDLTAARFGRDAAGRRYYRTGDLGRIDPDGLVWVLGRRDGQVKIRGFRVETAEVEVALLEAPGVQAAAVLADGDDDTTRRLVAFVGAGEAADRPDFAAQLRRHLAARVPAYMLPAEIVVRPELPLTHLRKVDRVGLRAQLAEIATSHRRWEAEPLTVPADRRAHHEQVIAGMRHPTGTYYPFTAEEQVQPLLLRWQQTWRRDPARLAAEEGARRLTYAEVEAVANRWAHAILAQLGPGSEPVGLLFDVELDQALGMLAVWKAGKFFFQMDPSLPPVRNRAMVEDAQTRLVVTGRAYASQLPAVAVGVGQLVVEEIPPTTPATAPDVQTAPDDIAYLLYTSGSTGKPKGVVNDHASLIHYLGIRFGQMKMSDQDRVSQISLSIGGIFGVCSAWLNGACLLPFRVRQEGLVRFDRWVREAEVTLLQGSVPRAWLAALDGSQTYPHLRGIMFAAGPTYAEHVAAYRRYLPDTCSLLNVYAASEISVMTYYAVDKQTEFPGRILPAGYPPAGIEVEIWGHDRRALPAGENGEVVIFTPYANRGYWRQPELTARRFGVDAAGRRYYRTGDLGRLDADGCLWVLGRYEDGQVKIRGHRVETAEVEVALLELPVVREVGVIAQGHTEDDRCLVAFVGMAGAGGLSPAASAAAERTLRRELARRLPAPMVPARFVCLDALPRNANGKVDRPRLAELADALPAPAAVEDDLPDSDTECVVAQMVGELLGRDGIGRDADFFELGGHSLLAARLMLRIHRQWGVDLPPRHFFDRPTVAALAAAVDAALHTAAPSVDNASVGLHAVHVVDGDPGRLPFFLMAGGGGSTVELLWYHDFIHNLGADQPVYALLAHGPEGQGAIYGSVGEMVVDAIAAVRRIQPKGPYLLGGECIGGKLAFEMARVLEQEGEEVALCMLLDAWLPDDAPAVPLAPVSRLWRRLGYHWTHVQRLGWRAGASHALELVGRALPRTLYHNPQAQAAQDVRESYRRLLSDYRPVERYGRRVVVILSEETQRRHPAWRSLAAEVEEHVVEGTHQTYLSVAVRETAAQVRAHLRRAQGLPAG